MLRLAVTQPQFQTEANLQQAIFGACSVTFMTQTRILSCFEVSDYSQTHNLPNKHYSIQDCPQYSIEDKGKPLQFSPSTNSPIPSRKPNNNDKSFLKHKLVYKAKPKPKPKSRKKIFQRRYQQKHPVRCMKRHINPSANSDKPIKKTRHEIIEGIMDWMMEAASVLKLTKNAYYRSLAIFNRISQRDCRILSSKKLGHFVCVSLVIGAKFQSLSYAGCLRRMFEINFQRLSHQQLIWAQYHVLELLEWKVPVHTHIQEELGQIIRKWNDYIRTVTVQLDRTLMSNLLVNSWDKDNNTLYIEIVYILDFLFLAIPSFTTPIVYSLYITTNIKYGDVQMSHHKIWPYFEIFLKLYELIPQGELGKFRADAERYFHQLKIIEVIGRIPLGLELKKLIKRKDQQFYIQKVEYSH